MDLWATTAYGMAPKIRHLIVTAIAMAVLPLPAPAAAAEPEAGRLVSDLTAWLLQRDHAGVRNGLRRKVTYVRGSRDDQAGEIEAWAAPQSTAACATLDLLATLYQRGGEVARGVDRALVHEFGAAVLGFQAIPDPERPQLFSGAIAGSDADDSSMQYYTTFGNAVCGRALLAAFRATNDERYRSAAVQVADFLLRMQDPQEHYARFEANPFVDEDGAPLPAPGGYVDSVSSWGNLINVISTWNLAAITFMDEVDAVSGVTDRRYARSAERAKDFLLAGLRGGYDWYTPRFSSPATAKNRIVPYRGDPDYDCRDNAWHRKGSCAVEAGVAIGGTLGTDMVEYGLAALDEYGRRRQDRATQNEASSLYLRYADLPAWDSAVGAWVPPFWKSLGGSLIASGLPTAFDAHLSFGGYFYAAGGAEVIRAEARYYDIVGFGILAPLRSRVVPDQFANALSRVARVGAGAGFAMLDRSLEPLWVQAPDSTDLDADGSTTERVWKLTRGTLPTATIALGVLEAAVRHPAEQDAPNAAPPTETTTQRGPHPDREPSPARPSPTPLHSPATDGTAGSAQPSRTERQAVTLGVSRRQNYRTLSRRGIRLRLAAPRGDRVTITVAPVRSMRRHVKRRTLGRRVLRSRHRTVTARVRLGAASRRALRRALRERRAIRVTVSVRAAGAGVSRRTISIRR